MSCFEIPKTFRDLKLRVSRPKQSFAKLNHLRNAYFESVRVRAPADGVTARAGDRAVNRSANPPCVQPPVGLGADRLRGVPAGHPSAGRRTALAGVPVPLGAMLARTGIVYVVGICEKCTLLDAFNPAIRVCVIPQTHRYIRPLLNSSIIFIFFPLPSVGVGFPLEARRFSDAAVFFIPTTLRLMVWY